MDVVDAYARVGSYRGAAAMCGVDPKTVKRKVLAHERGELDDERARRAAVPKNTDRVRDVVLDRVREANGRGTAKRLLPVARAAGYVGSDRNFRRLVASVKRQVRGEIGRHQRRPAVWTPGETLVIDWGTLPGGLHVFCAVVAWSRVRFVRIARDETAATTMALLAECFEAVGGVPAKVLADRMGCLKGGTVAGVVIPTPDYVRFATHYRFSPDFCHPHDPESKGIVENLGLPRRVTRSRTVSSHGLSSASPSTARCGSTTSTVASWSPFTSSSPLVRRRFSTSTTRHRGGRRHAGHGHAPTSSVSSSPSATRPRRSSVPAQPPG
jgi:transposase